MKLSFKEKLTHLINAGFQIIHIPTTERSRCEQELMAIAKDQNMKYVTWDVVNGIRGDFNDQDLKDPIEALSSLGAADTNDNDKWGDQDAVFVFRNLHAFIEADPTIRQAFQNLYYGRKISNDKHRRVLVMISTASQLNPEVLPCVTTQEFSLPTPDDLEKVFDEIATGLEGASTEAVTKYTPEQKDKAVQALRGLTTLEAENTFAYSLRVCRGFREDLTEVIEDQKSTAIAKSEILTYVPRERIASMDDIGGYDNLKEFISQRRLAYSKKARELGMDLPRGIVLLGVPGTGKSVVGKVIARSLDLPLVNMNFSAVFGSLVGESERRMRDALATIDALDGAVVLVDEAEKGLGGAGGDGPSGDSGVSRRVFGVLLTWLTEKTSRSFVVMTMNRTRGIPPEFLRKGRFDEIFYTDIPTKEERDQILRIHCRKRKVDADKFAKTEWDKLVEETNNFVGSELEQIVCDARVSAFYARQTGQPSIEEMLNCAKLITPIALTDKANIDDIRNSCEGKARPVSRKTKTVTKSVKRQVTVG